jgi:hypothetical protein
VKSCFKREVGCQVEDGILAMTRMILLETKQSNKAPEPTPDPLFRGVILFAR